MCVRVIIKCNGITRREREAGGVAATYDKSLNTWAEGLRPAWRDAFSAARTGSGRRLACATSRASRRRSWWGAGGGRLQGRGLWLPGRPDLDLLAVPGDLVFGLVAVGVGDDEPLGEDGAGGAEGSGEGVDDGLDRAGGGGHAVHLLLDAAELQVEAVGRGAAGRSFLDGLLEGTGGFGDLAGELAGVLARGGAAQSIPAGVAAVGDGEGVDGVGGAGSGLQGGVVGVEDGRSQGVEPVGA